jgi:hypothetical protein
MKMERSGKYMKIRKTDGENFFKTGLFPIGLTVAGFAILYALTANWFIDTLKYKGLDYHRASEYVQGMDTLSISLRSQGKDNHSVEYPTIGVDHFLFAQSRKDAPSGLGARVLADAYSRQFAIDNHKSGSKRLDLVRGLGHYVIRVNGPENLERIKSQRLEDSLGYDAVNFDSLKPSR